MHNCFRYPHGLFCIFVLALVFTALVPGCANQQLYRQGPILADLKITILSEQWDGRRIPDGQQCRRDGGRGSTPVLRVENIPSRTSHLLIEISDKSFIPMDNGGHGIIGMYLKPGTTETTIAALPGHTFSLPDGYFVVSAHRRPAWDAPGAYLPPCSGGTGHYYYLFVKAVYAPENLEKIPELLGRGKIFLGRY